MRMLLSAAFAAGLMMTPAALAQEKQGGTPPSESPAATPATNPGSEPLASPGAASSGETGMSTGASEATPEAEAHSETPHYPLAHPATLNWTFSGPLGHWDIGQLQRGLKVYKEVCSACHSLDLVAFRNLEALGYNENQVKGFAAQYQIKDPNPSATGEIVERPGIPSDYFPSPFPNPEAAAAANNGAAPPDLSLMAKARAVERGFPWFVFDIITQYAQGGPDYIHGLLTGYDQQPPSGVTIQPGTHYNPYFMNGPALAMPQPINDGQVTYDDGAPQTVDQYARDVAAFLMWTAEPHLVERKATGLVVMIFLIAFAAMLLIVKRRVWADTPH